MRNALAPILAVGIAVAVGACIFLAFGVNPLTAYGVMASGALGSGYAITEILVKATPLLLTGLAVALAARMLLWNIGCEGQLVMGGVFAAGFALFAAPGLPGWLMVPAVLLAGALGGGLWAGVPGWLRARFGASEILTTLLLNYVAILLMEHLYYGPWRDPMGFGFPGTAALPLAAELPRLTGRVHLGLPLAVALAVALWWVLERTRFGYSVRVIGQSPKAARYAGFSAKSRTVLVMLLSGALAGLAGAGEVCGIHGRLQEGLAVGYGYDGIIVAWLASRNFLAVPVAAAGLGLLLVGGDQLQSQLGLPSSISLVLEAVLLFGFLTGEKLSGRLARRREAALEAGNG
ncbi:ABC transporter permease [Desulfohalovibrio reitneri]|uniref:ABC transporter permease n=1 Tax=Desulfohalovibrio reitneri TaxID=1307759 RepID=UPI0006916B5B|nr:ABC transporter permease [Desulfohalovibrio reitneri]